MTDAHFHRHVYDTFLRTCGKEVRFHGIHPWQAAENEHALDIDLLRERLETDHASGVGEIGLDRLKAKTIPDAQRTAFALQLELAAELGRPVVLHGAKCWGEVVAACRPFRKRIPAFLFHGFSRSAGLLADIFDLNGFVSVGPALLNDHAVNYRALAKDLPEDRILAETDMDLTSDEAAGDETLRAIVATLAALRGEADSARLESRLDANASRFLGNLYG